jgi:hypothetical protein
LFVRVRLFPSRVASVLARSALRGNLLFVMRIPLRGFRRAISRRGTISGIGALGSRAQRARFLYQRGRLPHAWQAIQEHPRPPACKEQRSIAPPRTGTDARSDSASDSQAQGRRGGRRFTLVAALPRWPVRDMAAFPGGVAAETDRHPGSFGQPPPRRGGRLAGGRHHRRGFSRPLAAPSGRADHLARMRRLALERRAPRRWIGRQVGAAY